MNADVKIVNRLIACDVIMYHTQNLNAMTEMGWGKWSGEQIVSSFMSKTLDEFANILNQ